MTDDDTYALEVAAMEEEKAARAQNKKLRSQPAPVDEKFIPFPDLTPKELMALCEAQVSESGVAAYFGFTVDDLRMRIESNSELEKIYEFGREKGKAQIQVTQFSIARAGDAQVLKAFGENWLGQKSKLTVEMDDENVRKWLAAAEAKIGQQTVLQDLRRQAEEAVDAEYEIIDDSHDEKS